MAVYPVCENVRLYDLAGRRKDDFHIFQTAVICGLRQFPVIYFRRNCLVFTSPAFCQIFIADSLQLIGDICFFLLCILAGQCAQRGDAAGSLPTEKECKQADSQDGCYGDNENCRLFGVSFRSPDVAVLHAYLFHSQIQVQIMKPWVASFQHYTIAWGKIRL